MSATPDSKAAPRPPVSTPAAPRFSVTVPAYDAAATLAETLKSVRDQSFTDWELVIVDDGSRDGTRAIAERFARADSRVRVIPQENRGSGGAYNTAVRAARADLLVMLSADDLLLPRHLERLDAFVAEHPEAGVYTCDGWYEYDDGRRRPVAASARWDDPSHCSLEELLWACFYGVGAVYRRAVFDAVGGFREDLHAEDYLFWLLALAHGFEHRHLNEPLSVHRRSAAQKSASGLLMRETDLRVIAEVIESRLLTPEQTRAAARSAARLRRNLQMRKALATTIGAERLEALIARSRPLRRRVRSSGPKDRLGRPTVRETTEGRRGGPPQAAGLAVAFLNNFAGPTLGGGEVQLLALVPGLVAAGVKPIVVCAAGSALEREARLLEGVAVIPADSSPRALPGLPRALALRLFGVDVVQGTGFLTNLVARRVGPRARATVVNTVHVVPGAARLDGEPGWRSALRATLDRLSRRGVARFVAVSQAVADALVADGVSAPRIVVIPNGVDGAGLRRTAAHPLLSPAPGVPLVGFLGRLETVKGGDVFLRAAARLTGDRPEVRFVVAGEGSRAAELKGLRARLGLSERLAFLGHVASAAPFLASLDVVVVPSRSEASGLTAMEAQALGVPVVAARVGGLPEVIVDGETGLLFPSEDAAALARAVGRLLDDPEMARRLASAGVRRVDEFFTVERMVAGYVRLYEELAPWEQASLRRPTPATGSRTASGRRRPWR